MLRAMPYVEEMNGLTTDRCTADAPVESRTNVVFVSPSYLQPNSDTRSMYFKHGSEWRMEETGTSYRSHTKIASVVEQPSSKLWEFITNFPEYLIRMVLTLSLIHI